MKIELDTLRAALNQLLDHAEARHGKTIELDEDLYWFVPQERLHDVTVAPADLTLGSLYDDWAEVSAIAAGEKEPIGYVCVWASSVLRFVGDGTMG